MPGFVSDIKTIQIEDIIKGASQLQITYQEALKHEALSPVASNRSKNDLACKMTKRLHVHAYSTVNVDIWGLFRNPSEASDTEFRLSTIFHTIMTIISHPLRFLTAVSSDANGSTPLEDVSNALFAA